MKIPYKIVMMNKHEIPIDPDELPKVLQSITKNSPAILKQGIFNPNCYSHIIEDKSRLSVAKETDALGHYTGGLIKIYSDLPNIFADIGELTELKNKEVKKLR